MRVVAGLSMTACLLLAGCGGTRTITVTVTTAAKPKAAPRLTAKQKLAAYCKSHASASLLAKPVKCLTKKQRATRAKLSRTERAQAKRVAAEKARAARTRAANEWHQGYHGPIFTSNGAVYAKWVKLQTCARAALDGCWHIKVTTAQGCSSLYVETKELQGKTVVGSVIANQNDVRPRTPVLLELDADTSKTVTASAPKISCYP